MMSGKLFIRHVGLRVSKIEQGIVILVSKNIKMAKNIQKSHIRCNGGTKLFQGDFIIKQGDPGNYFYVIGYGRYKAIEIIDSGEVEVTKNAVVVATIGEWGTFGELALTHTFQQIILSL